MLRKPTIEDLSSRLVKVGSKEIYISELGSGEPVLMLHGGGPGASGMSNYPKNVAALAENFHVIVADMPGYGPSTKGVNRKDPFGDLADNMLGLLDALGVKSAHLIGNSLGGACALRLALDHPERVSSMVLMGPGGVGTTRALPTKGLNLLLNYYKGDGPSLDKLNDFVKNYLVYDASQVPAALVKERFDASIDPQVIAAPPLRRPTGLAGAIKMDFTRDARLKNCEIPTLVLWGIDDLVNRPSGAEALQKRMKDCDVYLFSKTGHWVQWERAEEFNAITTSFIKNRSK